MQQENNFHKPNKIVVGIKINHLLVLECIPPNTNGNKSSRSIFVCQCDCGNIITTAVKNLQRQNNKIDCGCGTSQRQSDSKRKYKYGEAAYHKLISSYKSNSKKKNLSFDLSNDECYILFKSNCFYCGIVAKQEFRHKKCWGEFIYNGIDRLDSNKGYIIDNVVSCCSRCNYLKSDMEYKDFIDWISKVYHYRILNS